MQPSHMCFLKFLFLPFCLLSLLIGFHCLIKIVFTWDWVRCMHSFMDHAWHHRVTFRIALFSYSGTLKWSRPTTPDCIFKYERGWTSSSRSEIVLSLWDFSHGKFVALYPEKAICDRVALSNLQCMPGVLVSIIHRTLK